MKLLRGLQTNKDAKKRSLFYMVVALAALFASFISLCGHTHAINVLRHFLPENGAARFAQTFMLVLCAAVSLVTAVIAFRMFPMIMDMLARYELNGEGKLQHVENYLVEVVEMVKESVIVLGEDLKIVRCNEASKALFQCADLVGSQMVDFIHPEDTRAFEEAMVVTLGGYSQMPTIVEYRIAREAVSMYFPCGSDAGAVPVRPKPNPRCFSPTARKVHVASGIETSFTGKERSLHSTSVGALIATPSVSSFGLSSRSACPDVEYVWVESTVCKGMRLTPGEEFEYDLKMITRDISERKKQAETQLENILRENQEQARINAAKLRYISCIAHDLKTPLQSFCFSLDLLQQSGMSAEQLECAQQASVAVDLMKLTISQTMDISKALSGAKLVPRCTTVALPTVLDRVKIIM
jgi:PAS domain-containing protein